MPAGDKLNFGIAAERAKAAGIPVEVVVVSLQERGASGNLGLGVAASSGLCLNLCSKQLT